MQLAVCVVNGAFHVLEWPARENTYKAGRLQRLCYWEILLWDFVYRPKV